MSASPGRLTVARLTLLWPYGPANVPPELEAKLRRLAGETGRTADQVALDLLTSLVEHGDWFRREVEKGRLSAREGRLLDHDEIASWIDRRYRG